MSITLNGTTGITTPALDSDGLTVARAGGAAGSGNVAYIDVTSSYGGLSINSSAGNNAFIEFLENGVKTAGFNSDATANVTSLQSANGHALAFNTDGTTERMRIDSAGRVTMPYQPCFSAYANGSESVSDGSAIPYGNATFNVGSYFNTGNYRFTAPVLGVYMFIWSHKSVANSAWYSRLTVNGSQVAAAFEGQSAITNPHTHASAIVQMSANDFAWIRSGSANVRCDGSDYFSGFLIG
jgi:hypothetical protein